jgi:hypothetical protein
MRDRSADFWLDEGGERLAGYVLVDSIDRSSSEIGG